MIELFGFPWQDILLGLGGATGLSSKAYALWDEDTVWSRWASIPNAIMYIGTVAAFYTLGLYITAATSTISMLIWFGIGLWRAPDADTAAPS